MTIREEFEKAFEAKWLYKPLSNEPLKECALWAAKWMAERCAKRVETIQGSCEEYYQGKVVADELRKLAKELSNDH